jgi:hypothetical protein
MLPAGAVDGVLEELVPLLAPGDVMIDGGNSHYRDDLTRAARLRARGVHYVDCGTCGGVWGRERGYCLMIGGDDEPVRRLDPIWRSLAPGEAAARPTPGRDGATGTAAFGYLHCGPAGAGHFVKMVHNGVEYGMMAALAEGLAIIRGADAGLRGTPSPTASFRRCGASSVGTKNGLRPGRRATRRPDVRVRAPSPARHRRCGRGGGDRSGAHRPGSPRPGCGPTPPSSLPPWRRRRPGVIGDAGPEGGRRGLRRAGRSPLIAGGVGRGPRPRPRWRRPARCLQGRSPEYTPMGIG